jgi:hypothetical protein
MVTTLPFKYYEYVSDSKVDMLFASVPVSLRERFAAELKIDLRLVSATVTERPREETRYSKLAVVLRYFQKEVEVGSVDDPAAYFQGTLVMRWGPISNGRAIYFGGVTERTVLGMGGSRKHVLHSAGDSTVPDPGGSATAELIDVLRAADPSIAGMSRSRQPTITEGLGEFEAEAIYTATTGMDGIGQRLEFLARRVAVASGEIIGIPQRILLGTPIYVAQAD